MCRLYALNTWLIYLTEVVKVSSSVITDGFYAGTAMTPQEYHFSRVGEALKGHFADWAACNAAGLSAASSGVEGGFHYLTPLQRERACQELDLTQGGHSFVESRHEFAVTLPAPRSADEPLRIAPGACLPRGWAYNVIRLKLHGTAAYTVTLRGQRAGSEGQPSHFLGRIVIGSRRSAISMEMQDSCWSWPTSVQTGEQDHMMLIVVASVPTHFKGNQTYGYEVEVSHGAWTTPGQATGGTTVNSAEELRRKRLQTLEKR